MIALLLAYTGIKVDPRSFSLFSFLSLAYPFILLVNLIFLLIWMVGKKLNRVLVVSASILIGWNTLFNFIQLIPKGAEDNGVKVLSYNIRLFDLYNWSANERSLDKIISVFKRERADVLCLQEYYDSGESKYLITKNELLERSEYKFIHDEFSQRTKNDHQFGIATMSNSPIVAKGRVTLKDEVNNMCIWTDVAMLGDTVRIYNAHLASIHFGEADYAFIQEPGSDENVKTRKGLQRVKRLAGLLNVAFKKRASQVEQIKEHMSTCKHPIVYAGDLNDSPTSYAYNQLSEKLTDSFISSGSGIGNTYIGAFPSFRIDHIMHSDELQSSGFTTLEDELSDHHPISCVLTLSGD